MLLLKVRPETTFPSGARKNKVEELTPKNPDYQLAQWEKIGEPIKVHIF